MSAGRWCGWTLGGGGGGGRMACGGEQVEDVTRGGGGGGALGILKSPVWDGTKRCLVCRGRWTNSVDVVVTADMTENYEFTTPSDKVIN